MPELGNEMGEDTLMLLQAACWVTLSGMVTKFVKTLRTDTLRPASESGKDSEISEAEVMGSILRGINDIMQCIFYCTTFKYSLNILIRSCRNAAKSKQSQFS